MIRMHPRSKNWHLFDYVIVRLSDKAEVLDTRAMRGADCGTDHAMIQSKIVKRDRYHKTETKPPRKRNLEKLKHKETQEELIEEMDKNLKIWIDENEGKSVNEKWTTLRGLVHETAKDVLCNPDRKHQDWFNNSDQRLHELLEARDTG